MKKTAEWDDTKALFQAALKDAYTELVRSNEAEWREGTPESRKLLGRLVAENKMVAKGYVPSNWRFTGTCKVCGDVPLEGPADEPLVGCPWCASGSRPTVYCYA